MPTLNINKAKSWKLKYEHKDFNPKLIFNKLNSKHEILFSLGFFLSIMSIETLFNQPFQRRIKIFHNKFYKKLFKKKFDKIERIEVNSFAYSLFLILQKVFEEKENLKKYAKEIIDNSICHWSYIEDLNDNDFMNRLQSINNLWEKNKHIILSRTYDSRIDLIFLLYKSFELGISDKKIIKKNLSVLIFSVSKAQKEFRYDVVEALKNINL